MHFARRSDHRGFFVTLRILLWRVHVAFGVNGVVVVPVGDRSAGNPSRKELTVRQGKSCHEAAVTMTAHPDPGGIDIGIIADPANGRLNVFQFMNAQFFCRRSKSSTPPCRWRCAGRYEIR